MVIAACLAALATIRLRSQFACAGVFAIIFSLNGYWLKAFQGTEAIFQACILAEILIALCVQSFRHRSAEWLVLSSFGLVVMHVLAWIGYATNYFEWFYWNWQIVIPAIEAGQILGILTTSDPIYNRIAARAARKKSAKKEYTWLPTILAPR